MDWIGIVALIVLLSAATLLVGLLLPRHHKAASEVWIGATPRRVWELLTDFSEQPAWRPDLLEIERLPDVNGRPVWRERTSRGSMTFVVDDLQPTRRLTVRMADKGVGFAGSWTYDVAEEDGGTRVSIIESGEIRRPMRRVLSRFLFGHHKPMDQYLETLARALGEMATPEKVRDPTRIEELLRAPAPPPRVRRGA